MRAIVRLLYALARLANDLSVVFSGNPRRVRNRLVNKLIGRHIVRRLWWRWTGEDA